MNLQELYNKYSSREAFIYAVDRELNILIANNPDFVYPDNSESSCSYVRGPFTDKEKCTGCIFGQALQKLGVDEGLNKTVKIQFLLQNAIEGFTCPDKWKVMQRLQDSGVFWGNIPVLTNTILENRF